MIKSRLLMLCWFLLAVFLTTSVCLAAVTNTWDGSDSTDWFTAGNWSEGVVPTNGQDVLVTNVANTVLLTNSTADLASFTITGEKLTFTNWSTTLTASNVTILDGGTLTIPAAFTDSQMSNRVYIVCTNFTLETGGTIDADAKGYQGDCGPGAGYYATYGGGGGYGGQGGAAHYTTINGPTYGSTNAPVAPGSGGSHSAWANGGSGGGVVRIDAANVTLNGTITADGSNPDSRSGGGSGGAIYITCGIFGGSTNGILSADGAYTGASGCGGGGGGGGRIAIIYNSLAGQHSVRLSVSPGSGTYNIPGDDRAAQMGTLYFPDTNLLSEVLVDITGYLVITNFTSWSPGSLTVNDGAIGFDDGFNLNIASNLLIAGANGGLIFGTNSELTCGGDLTLNSGQLTMKQHLNLTCGGDLTLTNGGEFYVYSGMTNGLAVDYGALVSVTGDVLVGSSSWIYPYSHSTDGGSPLFRMNDLVISTNAGFNADANGYARDQGPGKGTPGQYAGGAGYGGKGGDGYTYAGGSTYGSTNAPVDPGSGGGSKDASYQGGKGGGAVRIEAAGNVTINGTITANGGDAPGNWCGGGSGGAIFITCDTLGDSTNCLLSANGANGKSSGGGGGGGRIAIGIGLSEEARDKLLAGEEVSRLYTYENHAAFAGTISVTNGTGYYNPPDTNAAYPGTRIFMTTNYCLTVTGNPANYDSPTPHCYGTHIDIPEGSSVTNSVSSPVDEADGMRHTCFGWNLDDANGSYVSNGTSTQAVFQLTTNLMLTWNWTNEYELTLSCNTNGTVSTNLNGWYTNTVEVSGITASGSTGYAFLLWTGDVPSGSETNNPLSVTMDQARTIQAQFYSLSGQEKTWTGSGNWESLTNWSPEGMPGPYDDVIIESGSVILSTERTIESLSVSNSAELIFTNWTTTLTASNVTIQSGGIIGIAACFTDSQMSNRVHIVCTNLTVETNGTIDADAKGYARDNGPGKGTSGQYTGGAGYGGEGADGWSLAGGTTYGSTNAPVQPGSGGGSYSDTYRGGAGGGAVQIEATGDVTINGTIKADGENAPGKWSGGGSGGAIYITCGTFGGNTNGTLHADGADGGSNGGGGGGGRIALLYDSLAGQHSVRLSTCPGNNGYSPAAGHESMAQIGTLYFPNTNMLSEVLTDMTGYLVIPTFTNWLPGSLTVSNGIVGFEDGFSLNVTSNLLITGASGGLIFGANSELTCGGDLTMNSGQLTMKEHLTLTCGGDLILTNSGEFYFYSGITNVLGADYGALVSVTGDIRIASSSWIYSYSATNDGGSVLFRMDNLVISTNGGFNADWKGYARDQGPGKGTPGQYAGGAGYGGKGGDGYNYAGGSTYGSTNAPVDPGSGGGSYSASYQGGKGGGAVRIEAAGSVTINGTITANGGNALGNFAGGGSGGAIFITCDTLGDSTNGLLSANGANGLSSGGGGGGGRIAVWYGVPESERARILAGDMRRVSIITNASDYSDFSGTVSVTNGVGYTNLPPVGAECGTVVFLTVTPPSGTMFMCQ